MIQKTVYLVGPVTGELYTKANDWRRYASDRFPEWLVPISPLRGQQYLKDVGPMAENYAGQALSTPQGIRAKGMNDVNTCDGILVNFLKAPRVSIGSVMEIAWAYWLRKPIVIVMEPDNLHQHVCIKDAASAIVPTLDDGIRLIVDFLSTGL